MSYESDLGAQEFIHPVPGTDEVIVANSQEELIQMLGEFIAGQTFVIDDQKERITELESENTGLLTENDRLIEEIKLQAEEIDILTDEANTDYLTEIRNRRGFIKAVEKLREEGKKVMIKQEDLVNFKALNDAAGHKIGDLFLKLVYAKIIAKDVREEDVAAYIDDRTDDESVPARIGGDEFAQAIVLATIDEETGELVDPGYSPEEIFNKIFKRETEDFQSHPFVVMFNSLVDEKYRLGVRSSYAVDNGEPIDELLDKSEPIRNGETDHSVRRNIKKLSPEVRKLLEEILLSEQ